MGVKGKSVIFILIFLVLITLGVSGTMLFKDSNYKVINKEGFEAVDKIRKAEITGNVVELTEENLNEMSGIYFKNGRGKENLTIKGMNISLQENKMFLRIPLSLKKINLLISTKGESTLEGDFICYNPDFLKVGSLTIPKKFLFNNLKKYKNVLKENGIDIEENKIKIPKKTIPFKVKSFNLKDNKVYVEVEKIKEIALKVKEESQSVSQRTLVNEEKKEPEKDIKAEKDDKSKEDKGEKQNNEYKGDNTADDRDDNENNNTEDISQRRQEVLGKLYGQLSCASSSLANAEEKSVIEAMLGTIGKMQSNTNYNYNGDAGYVKRIYGKLSPEGRKRVKSAIFSNVDAVTIGEVRSTFGL